MKIGILIIILSLTEALLLTSCGLSNQSNIHLNSFSGGIALKVVDAQKNQQALLLLQHKCVSCHSQSYLDINYLYQNQLIQPGNSKLSKIYLRTADLTMAPGLPLSTTEIAQLADWIDHALILEATQSSGTPASQTPTLAFPPGASALTQQALTLLHNKCSGCHNDTTGESTGGGILNIVDPRQIIISGLATPGNASTSPIYRSITPHTQDGNIARMPKTPAPSLTNDEINLIRDWINTDLTSNPLGLTDYTPIPLTATYTSIRQNILATRCTLCHGGSRGIASGKNYSNYSGTKATISLLNPSQSLFYTCLSNNMPEEYPELSNSEKQIILNWISAGGLNN